MASDPQHDAIDPGFLRGGGEMGERIRAYPWAESPLGPPASWSPSWRTVVRVLLTTNHPVFLFLGPELVCLYNDAYARSLGPEKHPAILGTRAQEHWAEIWDIIGPQIEYVMAGKGSTWHENQLVPITRHGARQDVYWTYGYSPIDDPAAPSGVGGVLVLCTETTAQVQAQARMHAAEQRWRQLFEQAPGFVCVLYGPQHRYGFANPGYFALVGAGKEILGRTVAETLPWAQTQGFVAVLDEVYRSGEPYVALDAAITLDGVQRHLDFVYQPIRNEYGDIDGIFVLGSEVTARHHAQESLLRRTEQLRLACEAADLGIHVYEPATQTLEWDDRMREIWGLASDETPTFELFQAALHEDDRPGMLAAVQRALDPAGDGHYLAEYRVTNRQDGRVRWVQANGKVTFADGRPQRLVGTVQDITEQRLADARRHEFLATLGHELRNPLAPIATSLYLIRHGQPDDETVLNAHAIIDRQLKQMVRLLEDLLDVVRVTNGRIDLRLDTVHLDEILQLALETAAPHIERGGHSVRVGTPARALLVRADTVRLAQVFANLLINACKYSDRGSCIDVVSEADGDDGVRVRVRDQGIGIPAAMQARVFDMFSQAEPSLHRARGGLGIGLSLARGLTELHGGRIDVHSAGSGQGSEFVVRLPLAPATEPASAGTGTAFAAAGTATLAGWRVLVVDDNLDAAASLAELLQIDGADVETVHDGHAALAAAEASRPDVLLLDIGLPGRNGYEVCAALRLRPWSAGLRIVALSGWGQDLDRERSRTAGFDAHLVKPVDYPTLLAAMRGGPRPAAADGRGTGGDAASVSDSAPRPPTRDIP